MNNSYTQLQGSLLCWLKHHQTRTTNQIREACVDLLTGADADPRNAVFKIFFPLLRMGLIEISDGGKYFASIPAILFYPQSHTAVAINLLDKQKEILNERFADINEDTLGLLRVKCHKAEIISFCSESRCQFSQPDITNSLKHFPTISQAVLNFERVMLTTVPVEYYDIVFRQWTSIQQDPGIFRCSRDAQRLFLNVNGMVLLIPDRHINPESRPLAESYVGMKHTSNSIRYDQEKHELQVFNITLPILIERLLRLASLDIPDAIGQSRTSLTFPSITTGMMKEICRIFEYKIYEQSN
jgi:hypothetical protein